MTQSIKQLVHAFKARGGKITFVPRGLSGECVEKSYWHKLRAPRVKEIYSEEKEGFIRRRREKREWIDLGRRAPVDTFIRLRNKKGI